MNANICCPFQTPCRWAGTGTALVNHFNENHGEYVVRNCTFTMQNQKVHLPYLVSFGEKPFLFNIRYDPLCKKKAKVLTVVVSLQLIGGAEDTRQLMYVVNLVAENRCVKRFVCNDIAVLGCEEHFLKFELKRKQIHDERNCSFPPVQNDQVLEEFFYDDRKITHFTLEISVNQHKQLQKINDIIVRDLECPICLEIMQAPISHCNNGHLLCHICTPQLQSCPTCRGTIAATRNLFAESVAEQVIRKCKYSVNGCSFVSPFVLVKPHEEKCEQRVVSCPVKHINRGCNWSGMINTILTHLQDVHKDNVLEVSQVVIPLTQNDLDREDSDCFVFEAHGEVFRLLYKYERQIFQWAVQLIGPSCDFGGFQYVFTIVTEDEAKYKFTMTYPCLAFSEIEGVTMWLACPINLIHPMIDENMNLTYSVDILKKSNS